MHAISSILNESSNSPYEQLQNPERSFSGTNGPWNDSQTRVRNAGHWIILVLRDQETITQKQQTIIDNLLSFLLSDNARPYDKTFHHLENHPKSRCNGLVGQAWTIEALVTAAEHLDRQDLIELSEEVFLLHPFDDTLAAWDYVDIDGEFVSLDKTFNHQLWFAMAGAMLAQHDVDPAIEEQVKGFLDELPENLNLYDSGLIYHPFKPEFDVAKYAKIFFEGARAGVAHKMVWNLAKGAFGGESGDPMKETSIGYHSFNLYAFGVLHEIYPNHPFWDHEKFQRALDYARSEEFKRQLDGNPYGYPYNVSGIEMAYVLEVFDDDVRDQQRWWLEQQFERTLDPETMTMSRNNPDPATLTARLYEATRLPDIEVSLDFETDAIDD